MRIEPIHKETIY